MAPAQVIELKDLPPEVLSMTGTSVAALPVTPELAVAAAAPGVAGLAAPATLPVAPPEVVYAGGAVESGVNTAAASSSSAPVWEVGLQAEALALLEEGRTDVWDVLTRRFETRLIQTALANTRGRRIEAAHKLGIGRNTITRKIQELNLE
jgi:two-component system nitrogen regulation response regulator GlnG